MNTRTFAYMIDDCIDNPVRSRHHEWIAGEQEDYDCLPARGRSLYDNLRTKHNLSHAVAWTISFNKFGL